MDQRPPGMVRRFTSLTQPDQYVRHLHQPPRALDTDGLYRIISHAKPRGIGQPDRHTGQRERYLDMIAGCSRDIGDDGALFSSYLIDKARFPCVWRSCDNNQHAVLQWLGARPLKPVAKFIRERGTAAQQRGVDLLILIVIVDRPLRAR